MKDSAFDDLIYLSKFLNNNQAKMMLRRKSFKRINSGGKNNEAQNPPERSRFAPKKVQKTFLQETPKGVIEVDPEIAQDFSNKEKMDIDEFLVHFNLHLQMNLDHVFESNLDVLITFFSKIEDFMKEFFKKLNLETKIDLMRLIIRMTNATEFVYKVYLLKTLDIEYLQYSQTFSLFLQVLVMELGISKL